MRTLILWPPSLGPFIIPSIYNRWPRGIRCGSLPAREGTPAGLRRQARLRWGRKAPGGRAKGRCGAVRRVECPQGGSRAHPDRRRGTDGQTGGRRPPAARSRRGALKNRGGSPRPRAGRRTAGVGGPDENRAEVRRGPSCPRGQAPSAARIGIAGVWVPVPAPLCSVCSRPRGGAGSGCPGKGPGRGAWRAGAQEVGRGPA